MHFQQNLIIRRPTGLADLGSIIDSFDGVNKVEDLYTLKDKGTAIIRDGNKAIGNTLRTSNVKLDDLARRTQARFDEIGADAKATLAKYDSKTLG